MSESKKQGKEPNEVSIGQLADDEFPKGANQSLQSHWALVRDYVETESKRTFRNPGKTSPNRLMT